MSQPSMTRLMGDAIRNGDVPTIEALLAAGESPNCIHQKSGWSALMFAAENQQLQSMRTLLAAGADPHYAMPDGWTALHHAIDSECDGQSQIGVPTEGQLTALLVSAGRTPLLSGRMAATRRLHVTSPLSTDSSQLSMRWARSP